MSKRLSKQATYEALEKKLRALNRRENALRGERFYWIELDKPLFQGYRWHLIYREDLKGRKDYPILEKLLPLIDRNLYSKTKDFTKRVRRKRKKRVLIPNTPTDVMQHKWEKLSEVEQSYFMPLEKFEFGRFTKNYRWKFPWMLVSKVEKHYVTKIMFENLDVRKELKEIKNYITKNGLKPKVFKWIYGGCPNWNDWEDTRDREAQIDKETRAYLNLKPEYRDEEAPQYFQLKKAKNPKSSSPNFSDFLFYVQHFVEQRCTLFSYP
jgi:hypothetical protein